MNKIVVYLCYMFAFFSGFADLPYTKIGGILIFVYIAGLLILTGLFGKWNNNSFNTQDYFYFIVFSIPALFIGLYYEQYDAGYFYAYTLFPLLLYRGLPLNQIDIKKFLLFAQSSLLVAMAIGWLIYLRIVPYTYIYQNVIESEFELGYWGISYLPSSRNHDYLYVFSCACFCLSLLKYNLSSWLKTFEVVVFFFCLVTLLLTMSRGAMIIAFWLLYLFYRDSNAKVRKLVSIIIAVIVLASFGYLIANYYNTMKSIFLSIFGLEETNVYGGVYSNASRKRIYFNAIEYIFVNPVGYGIQNYGIISDGYGSAENAYLTLLVERGWLAGLFFIKWLWFSIKKVNKTSLTYSLSSCLFIYFLFNYEFMSYTNVFLFFIILSSHKFKNDNSTRWSKKLA